MIERKEEMIRFASDPIEGHRDVTMCDICGTEIKYNDYKKLR